MCFLLIFYTKLTQWSRILVEKLIVALLVRNISSFYEAQKGRYPGHKNLPVQPNHAPNAHAFHNFTSYFFNINFDIALVTLRFEIGLFHSDFRLRFCMHFSFISDFDSLDPKLRGEHLD
jgi:hypothetical protein